MTIRFSSGARRRERWARRLRRIWRTPASRSRCSISRATPPPNCSKRAQGAQARSLLHQRRRLAHRPRRLRFSRGFRADRRRRLDCRSGRRTARRQAVAARARRRGAQGGRDRQLEHVGHSGRVDRRRPIRVVPPALARHALLQSAALSASCSRSFRPPTPIRAVVAAMRAFADTRLGKGVVIAKDTPNFIANRIAMFTRDALSRSARSRLHDRRDRRDHRSGDRPAEERDVPHARHHRHRSAAAGLAQSAGTAGRRSRPLAHAAADRRRARRTRLVRRKGGTGLLSQGIARAAGGELGDPHARSGDDDVSRAQIGAPARDRRDEEHRRSGRAHPHALLRQGPRRRIPARDAGADDSLRGARGARHRAFDRRRRSRDVLGPRLGPRAVRDRRRDRPAASCSTRVLPTRDRAAACLDHPSASRRAARTRSAAGSASPVPDGALLFRGRAETEAGHQEEPGREPDRSRRRRARPRAALEDEHDRRRHHRDARGRREGSRTQFRRARRLHRRRQLLGRRQPDAAVAGSAGRQLGRDRSDGPRVPAGDDGPAAGGGAGGGRAGGHGARRRLRDVDARRSPSSRGRNLHRPRRSRRRLDPRGRRHQGIRRARSRRDAGGRHAAAHAADESAAGDSARVRDDRVREGLDERRRGARRWGCCARPIASR